MCVRVCIPASHSLLSVFMAFLSPCCLLGADGGKRLIVGLGVVNTPTPFARGIFSLFDDMRLIYAVSSHRFIKLSQKCDVFLLIPVPTSDSHQGSLDGYWKPFVFLHSIFATVKSVFFFYLFSNQRSVKPDNDAV